MVTDKELEEFYLQGFIPSEDEGEEAFLKRIAYSLDIKKHLTVHFGNESPEFLTDQQKLLKEAKNFYGIDPSWIPIFFSNDKLLPWQGAAAWIFELEDQSPLSAMIQIRKNSWSCLGSKEEIITHEASHIGRMKYEEKKYEEFLAYASSSSSLRRYLGPLFRSSFESIFFMSLLILVVMFDFALLMSGSIMWYDRFMVFKLVPLFYLSYLVIRLILQHRTFNKALEKVNSFKLVYLMLDCEIDCFAHKSSQEVEDYLKDGKTKSLRRRLMATLANF